MSGYHDPASSDPRTTVQSTAKRLATLRAQREALEAEIVEVMQLSELEAQREALRQEKRLIVNEAVANPNGSDDLEDSR